MVTAGNKCCAYDREALRPKRGEYSPICWNLERGDSPAIHASIEFDDGALWFVYGNNTAAEPDEPERYGPTAFSIHRDYDTGLFAAGAFLTTCSSRKSQSEVQSVDSGRRYTRFGASSFVCCPGLALLLPVYVARIANLRAQPLVQKISARFPVIRPFEPQNRS